MHIYLAPEWKWDLYRIADEVGKPDVGQIIGRSIKENILDDKKEIANAAKKVAREITKTKYIGKIDEASILEDAKDFIEEEIASELVIHTDDSYDPQNKARNAINLFKLLTFVNSFFFYFYFFIIHKLFLNNFLLFFIKIPYSIFYIKDKNQNE